MARFVLIATFAVTALFTVPSFADDSLYYSAMDLAIEHFNADGSRELKAWGPEHTVMYKALEAVAKKLPEVKEASKMSAFGGERKFSSLAISVGKVSAGAARDAKATAVKVMKSVNALVDGCGYRRETNTEEQDLGYTKPSTTTVVTTTYRLDGNGKKLCTAQAAKVLSELGLNEVVVSDSTGRFGSLEVSFQSGGNEVQDMRYVKAVLKKSGAIDSDLMALLEPPKTGGLIGASSDITLVGSTGKAALNDKFTLKYYIGSGDCPAGCISKTYYTVEVEPKSTSGTEPKFKVTVL